MIYANGAWRLKPVGLPDDLRTDGDITDREALIGERRKMLDKVGWYSSEDLAAAAESITSNPSQCAVTRWARVGPLAMVFGTP
jgi:hypothetical protein